MLLIIVERSFNIAENNRATFCFQFWFVATGCLLVNKVSHSKN